MPRSVFVLGFAIFAQGTSEMMLAGLLPEMAADLGVTIARAGLLISGFALGMLLGAPILAIATLRWPKRRALLWFLAVFIVAHVVGALTGDYGVLMASRFVGAFVYAGFWAAAASTAIALVPENQRAKAMSIVAGGLTVATVIGLPAGTLLGQRLGWHSAFWAVAILSAISMLAIIALVPSVAPGQRPDLRNEIRGVGAPRLWLSYAMTATSIAALLVTFSYLGALLIDTTDLAPSWVAPMLLIYGVGAVLGIFIGGRTADERPLATLTVGFTAVVLTSVLIAVFATQPITLAVLLFLLGVAGFCTNPVLNSRVFGLAPASPNLAPALNVSSFNVGISVGPWLGGLALTAGFGYQVVGWIGAALASTALLLLLCERFTLAPPAQRRVRSSPVPSSCPGE